MPTESQYVPPAVFLVHRNVTVYHAYKDDDVQAGVLDFWFTLDEHHGTDTAAAFDVRQLATWQPPTRPPCVTPDLSQAERAAHESAWAQYHSERVEEQAIRTAIERAIDENVLQPYRCPLDWCEAIVPRFALEDENICPECNEGTSVPWTPPPPGTPPPRKPFLVKLEYELEAVTEQQAVDPLTAAIREAQPDAKLLRTDVRRPGEAGAW